MRVLQEKQWFNQWWLQLINFGILGFLCYTCYRWFILKKASGNVDVNDTTGQFVVIITLLIVFGIIYLFKLKTVIDERGIHYQFFPFHRNMKIIAWNEVENCYTRKYRPISEFGGWGYKFGMGGTKALNVKGNKGIQLNLKNGKKLLIGTQRPEEAQMVIDKYFKNERIQSGYLENGFN